MTAIPRKKFIVKILDSVEGWMVEAPDMDEAEMFTTNHIEVHSEVGSATYRITDVESDESRKVSVDVDPDVRYREMSYDAEMFEYHN